MKIRTVTLTFNENFISKLYWANTDDQKVFEEPTFPYEAGDEVNGAEWVLQFVRMKQSEILFNNPSYVNYVQSEFSNINEDDHIVQQRLFEKNQIDDGKLITTFLATKTEDNQTLQSKHQWNDDDSYDEYSKKYAALHELSIKIINETPNISATSSTV